MFIRALLVLGVSLLANFVRVQEQPAHPIHAGTAAPSSVAVRPQPKLNKAHLPNRQAAHLPRTR